ncbi:DUF3391 domain-containing protein [Paraglaciecola aquimarina]|uniref:DUF3391 domain-containing protein n=1 Tax=Paraglaciecola aquimarina TaxID=1235557 RepID=A0ABU3STM4_9ALTE|nr:DUF3391 domain-containing protein [Paraglaciecola aquimarina]MDU0353332.1 DUF3391 domain-containing protein [Paraglaciecola aquimarina]
MFKIFDIDELEVGMFVESIAKQSGTLKIKSRGRITSSKAIQYLKEKGIKQVNVDLSKQLKPEPSEPEPVPEPKRKRRNHLQMKSFMQLNCLSRAKVYKRKLLNRVALQPAS